LEGTVHEAKWMVAAIGGLALAACSVKSDDQANAPANGETATVTREEVVPSPSPSPSPTQQQAAIQSQPGPRGTTVALTRAGVTGDILTVALTYHGEGNDCCEYVNLDDVSVIDDATSQRLGVLKDDRGKWMAAPLYESDQNQLRFDIKNGVAQVWFKFPAPSAGAKTVSINVPNVAPFDGVPIAR